MPVERTILHGPLEVLRISGEPDGPTLILFHGYGADAYDLESLSQIVEGPAGMNWYFPNGPIEVPIGMGSMGRAWFPISEDDLGRILNNQIPIHFSQVEPPGLDKCHKLALDFISSLELQWSDLILGGFSQGAVLATDLVLRHEEMARGLVILSGTLTCESVWRQLAAKKSGLPFFQSHGQYDSVLAYDPAKKLNQLLTSSGLKGRFSSFRGGHEIPLQVTTELGQFLRSLTV